MTKCCVYIMICLKATDNLGPAVNSHFHGNDELKKSINSESCGIGITIGISSVDESRLSVAVFWVRETADALVRIMV